jgi:hypothetical protein
LHPAGSLSAWAGSGSIKYKVKVAAPWCYDKAKVSALLCTFLNEAIVVTVVGAVSMDSCPL